MGVHGLWRLIEPSGKPVPLETLENKVLAVDISIWLHQAIKGFQDAKGGAVPNAHLLGIYHRVCKLLYFRIKPVFVFDGGVPALKKQTIAKRNQLKSKNSSDADRLQKQLLSTLLKHSAISKVLSEKTKASLAAQTKKLSTEKDDLYSLPSATELISTISSSDEEEFDDSPDSSEPSPLKQYDLHSIDTKSPYFQSLPLETRHEILTDLKETRKQNSWGRLHELPKKSDDFSSYQMKRLLKRQQVQEALDNAAKEMGGASLSLTELESLFQAQGIPTSSNVGQRIASDANTRYLYIKDIKEAMKNAELQEEQKKDQRLDDSCSFQVPVEEEKPDTTKNIKPKTKADLEEEEELQRAIALSLEDGPSTSTGGLDDRTQDFSFLENFRDADFESDSSDDGLEKEKLRSAQSYMMEYSGLTPSEIAKIIGQNAKKKGRAKLKSAPNTLQKVNEMSNSISKTERQKSVVEAIEKCPEVIVDLTENLSEEPKEIELTEIKNNINEQHTIETSTYIDIQNKNLIQVSNIENEAKQVDNKSHKEINSIERDTKGINCVEIMSDSESTSSDDFCIVDDLPKLKKSHEVAKNEPVHSVINSETPDDEDDLFSDIFEDKKDIEKLEEILTQGTLKSVEKKTEEMCKRSLTNKIDGNFEKTAKEVQTAVDNENVKKSITSNIRLEPSENVAAEEEVAALEKNTDTTKTTVPQRTPTIVAPQLTISQLQAMKDNLQKEKIDILVEKSSKERLATNISDQMYQEAQELLQLFGVPYVVAPMEAEAQCAFLDEIDLTDGTITDDSDIWLFGGRTVYKNFFDQAKYVLEFKAENIKHNFKLTRHQMILLALLVGSDYTIGIRGVGPVTGLEILSAFPSPQADEFDLTQSQLISGLKEFKAWFNKGQSGGPGRSALKTKLKNVTFGDGFPNVQVVQAYMEPTVETSDERFSWCKPDFVALTLFAREKFGWSSKRTEEILNPVIKRVEESRIQKSIKEFFKTKFKIHGGDAMEKMSKRVKTAIERLGKTPEELIAEEMKLLEMERDQKLKKTHRETVRKRKSVSTDGLDDNQSGLKGNDDSTNTERVPREAKIRKKRCESDPAVVEDQRNPNKVRKTRKQRAKTSESDDFLADPPKKSRKKKTNEDAADPEPKRTKPKKTDINLLKEVESLSHESKTDRADELKLYANVASELRQRRQRKNELAKRKTEEALLQKKQFGREKPLDLPKELVTDVEVQHLLATTSRSVQKVAEIRSEVQKQLSEDKPKLRLTSLHNKDVIHQRLRDHSNLLKNKLRAIEVYRKSKKGPGFVPKRGRLKRAPKEDAGLSEDSDC